MHQRKSEYEPLLGEMLTVYIESSLASPLSGSVAIEVNPRSNVRDIINSFLLSLQRDSSVPGLAVFDKHFNKLDWNASIESQGIEEGSKLYIGYDKMGSVTDLPRSRRPSVSEATVELVRQSFQQSPIKSTRQASYEL
ncbi:hypothetical protein AVEN_256341-2 [Araneus ventricosus]|uniref:Uncharacterized protein n=1 Tax=Araneus ventricosus TaxID=182803 RepID=A0A4Y2RYE0_ARAVE|nr:hypothetical protein AVEN_256341-2 [Araneus ventricosus]